MDKPKPQTLRDKALIEASLTIPEKTNELIFQHSVLCQITLPYKNPGNEIRIWEKQQGRAILRIEAGSAIHPQTDSFVDLGLPYGAKPRLVLMHINDAYLRTGNRKIEIGNSMTSFMRSIGMSTDGRNIKRFKDQLSRLSCAVIRMGFTTEDYTRQVQGTIIDTYDILFTKSENQRVLWPSHIQISPQYAASLDRHAVPLNRSVITQLKNSAQKLDVYCFLAQRLYRIPSKKPLKLSWQAVAEQFGQGIGGVGVTRLRKFRTHYIKILKEICLLYPAANLYVDDQFLTLHHSKPPMTSSKG